MKEDAKTNEKTAEKLGQMVAMGDDAQAAAAAGCIYNQARASYLVDKKLGRTIDDAMPDKLAKASVILDNLERGNISPRDAYSKLTEIFDEQDLAPRKIETKSEQPTQKQANNGGEKSDQKQGVTEERKNLIMRLVNDYPDPKLHHIKSGGAMAATDVYGHGKEKYCVTPDIKNLGLGHFAYLNEAEAELFTQLREQKKSAQQTQSSNAMGWIAAHPFRYDKNTPVDENIAHAETYAQAFIDRFGTTDQINTRERQALRKQIADELYGNGAQKKEGKVWLIVGVPASGKSTIANPLVEQNGAILIDSDEAKEKLPEFANGTLATAVHEESSKIADSILMRAIQNNDNIVMPVVGKTMESLQRKINHFKAADYEVNLEYVDLPVEKAVQRVKSRFAETGRLVSPKYLESVGLKPRQNYDKLKTDKGVDAYEAWDNDVPRGASPRLIERSSQSQSENPAGLGGRRDNGRRVLQSDGNRNSDAEAERPANESVTDDTESRSDNQDGFSNTASSLKLRDKYVDDADDAMDKYNKGELTAKEAKTAISRINDEAAKDAGMRDREKQKIAEYVKDTQDELTRVDKTRKDLVANGKPLPAGVKLKDASQGGQDNSIFGSIEDADRELLEEFGIKTDEGEILEAPDGIVNTAEERERLEKELKEELNKVSANPVFNPKLYELAAKLAFTYIKDGINTAKKLTAVLEARIGDKITPWTPAIIETVRTWPKGVAFDSGKMRAVSKAVGARYEQGIRTREDMHDSMKELLKNRYKSFEPMIDAAYNGIEKFFNPTAEEVTANGQVQRKSGSTSRGSKNVPAEKVQSDQEGWKGSSGLSGEVSGGRYEVTADDAGHAEKADTEGHSTGGDGVETERSGDAGGGAGERGHHELAPLRDDQEHPAASKSAGHNYEIKGKGREANEPAKRHADNVKAIKLLKKLEAENRMPTPAEQKVLAGYSGWGGLTNSFTDPQKNSELKKLLTKDEYARAQSSIRDAYFTPPGIVRAIWKGVSSLGFKGGKVLDPSMGTGNFYGCMPRDMMQASSLYGIELDSLSSRFAKMLYPSAHVENTGFQNAHVADNYFDLVISNVPFAQEKIGKYAVHNFFFVNGIDKVRPGGLMVFITSQGSLTSSGDAATMRSYVSSKADFIGGFKLPSGVFKGTGTDVATDVLVFQRRGKDNISSKYAQDMNAITEYSLRSKNGRDYGNVKTNKYFFKHPENILGMEDFGRDRYGNPVLNILPKEGQDTAKELAKAMSKLPHDIYKPINRTNTKPYQQAESDRKARANDKKRDLEYFERDGKVYQNQGEENAVQVTGRKLPRIRAYLKVKEALSSLFIAQNDPDAKESALSALRKKLNNAYDTFVGKYGYINDRANELAFGDDPHAGTVMALETNVKAAGKGAKRRVLSAEKADIFYKRTVQAVKPLKHVDTAKDALLASLNNKGAVDVEYMAELTGKNQESIVKELGDKLYKDPVTETYQTDDEYLSGNVREKLEQAQEAAKADSAYQRNVDALKKAVPADLVSSEITVTMMRYLDRYGLKEDNVDIFDNWIRSYAEIGIGIERKPDGNGYRKVNKVKRFINMPELVKRFRKFTDVFTRDELEAEDPNIKLPKLKGGKRTVIALPVDPVVDNYIKNVVPGRVKDMKKGRRKMKKGDDNMLALTNDLRKLSMTDKKIDACAEQVAAKFNATNDIKGAQAIFCDMGVPKAEKETDSAPKDHDKGDDAAEQENEAVYTRLIASLVRHGIPRDQIAYAQSAKKEQLDELFQKVDNGEIRVIIGSTQKMGAGTNFQHHLVAEHHLDAPWRPRDIEQREGRIIRQGNPNEEVEIFTYVVKDSFDANMWEKLKNKASIIQQAMSSDISARTLEDADMVTLSYADVEGAATGNPLIKEKLDADAQVTKYTNASVQFQRGLQRAAAEAESLPKEIANAQDIISRIKDDVAHRVDTHGDKFSMIVEGKTYTKRT